MKREGQNCVAFPTAAQTLFCRGVLPAGASMDDAINAHGNFILLSPDHVRGDVTQQ
jgi:hypothetical protein